MKVITKTNEQRTVVIEATIDELVTLYDATRKGRRTKAQERALLEFGDLLRESDVDLAAVALEIEEDAGAE